MAAIVPVGAALVLLFQLLLSKSGLGRMIFLVGSSPSMANLAGIPVNIVRVSAYAISGMMSAYAGLSAAGFFQEAASGMGDQYLLGSIAAVVVGGTSIAGGRGSMIGTMGGALVLGQIATLLSIGNLGVSIQQIAYGLLILFVVSIYGRDSESKV
jgi:ribose transport system permease protein